MTPRQRPSSNSRTETQIAPLLQPPLTRFYRLLPAYDRRRAGDDMLVIHVALAT